MIIRFSETVGLSAQEVAEAQAQVRHRVLRWFVRRGWLSEEDRQAMQRRAHGGGFSVDAALRIVRNQPRTQRIQVNVAHQLQQIGIPVNQHCLVPALKQMAHTLLAPVDSARVAKHQILHTS